MVIVVVVVVVIVGVEVVDILALVIIADGLFSLTAIPCRMHRISFDLRS